ncbi:MAG TPA: hypothetical protein VGH19_08885 [Verrucomicrobiae bacterium]
MKTKMTFAVLLAAVLAGAGYASLQAKDETVISEPTAFQLIEEGNKYVGDQAKDKVVQIRADKSIGSTTPNVWYVVYYDHTAALKAVEVKFGAGKMMSVERPLRLLEPLFGKSTPLDRTKFKVDSDVAIKTALQEPLLANLKVVATAPKLEDSPTGPVWRVKIWAQKLRDTGDVHIGEVVISPETGEVIKNDLHIERAG